ncbi:MAG: alpha/beta hydrolase [Chloroflexi bacterium]|nr:alpha/beta hydrolase [Chloroflexota bacterium]MBM3175915.1 alpha/beta hydrolase [Chloroflexota bacterium]MBM4453689.1 alpha/beta hydrolase [Chloroflexota bacterium]
MEKLTLKEKVAYRFILNEKLVYRHWYTRFLICGVDLARIRRVVSRIKNFYMWCDEWSKEGEAVQKLAEEALANGNDYTARCLFHEAVGCFHIAQHIYFINIDKKNRAQQKAQDNYVRAIALYPDAERPIRIEIPFRGAVIPGYLRYAGQPNRPMVIHINGLDNIKEAENHYLGGLITKAGINFFTFDGPGQGEMWTSMKMIADYEKAVSAIIDWFEVNNKYHIDLKRIGVSGWSFGGYLAPRVAAFDKRICCAISNGGLGYINLKMATRVNPIWARDLLHVTGLKSLAEAGEDWEEIDLKKAPPLDRPFLIFHGGKDVVVPNPREQVDYMMEWAVGAKELKWYPDGEHCCANYFDEVLPYTIDWFSRRLSE